MFSAEWQEEEHEEPLVLKPEDIEPFSGPAPSTSSQSFASSPPPLPPSVESTWSSQPRPSASQYSSAKTYKVELCDTGFLSGTLSADKLETQINRRAAEGWRFVRSIQERRRVLGLFSREAHFLIFEKNRN
jgi:hypothetical protein